MTFNCQKYLFICLAAGVTTLLLGNLLIAALNQTKSNAINEECIGCHVSTFNQGIKNIQLHAPFWERQCIICHIAEGASWSAQANSSSIAPISATLVSQDELWRKVQAFQGSSGPAFDQTISMSTLDMNTAYRFRLAVSAMSENSGGEVYKSLWLGLRPDDIEGLNVAGQLNLNVGLVAPVSDYINTASLSRDGGTVFVAWETALPLYGWVELQELEGLSLTNLSPAEDERVKLMTAVEEHPPLIDPEYLAINACYQCHPVSALGTSHPVRLYSGRDVRIPPELPTVDGMLTCVTCHNPHGSEGKMLVRETIKTKLCVACHYKFKNSSTSTMFE